MLLFKTFFLCFPAFLFINSLNAQQTLKEKKIFVRGTAKTEIINSNGEEIIVSGNRHHITVKGYYIIIAVYGDECIINLDSVRLITLHGNKNRVSYKVSSDFKTRINRFGNYNRVTKIE